MNNGRGEKEEIKMKETKGEERKRENKEAAKINESRKRRAKKIR
jgi:hypothetical protein